MRMLQIIAAATALNFAVFTGQAQAEQDPGYFSLEVLSADISIDQGPEFGPAGGAISLGYELTRFLAIETRFGMTDSDSVTVDVLGTPVEVEAQIDNFITAFLRLNLPDFPVERVKPYLLVGYTRGESTVEALGYEVSDSDTDVSYGVGVNLYGKENDGFKIEATQYFDKDGLKITAYSIGYVHHF